MGVAVQEDVSLFNEPVLAQQIIAKGLSQPSPLLFMLHELQSTVGYISEYAILQISEALRVPMPEMLGIVSFHRQFKLRMSGEPALVARNVVRICSGTPCYAKGSQPIVDKLGELLGIQKGEITQDKRFALEMVDCLGACGMSPVMMINDDIYGNLSAEQLPVFLSRYA